MGALLSEVTEPSCGYRTKDQSLPISHNAVLVLQIDLLIRIKPALLDGRFDSPDVLLHVLAVQLRCLSVRRAVWVGVVQETLNGSEDGGYVVRRRPAILENVQTELAIGVDIWMEHA